MHDLKSYGEHSTNGIPLVCFSPYYFELFYTGKPTHIKKIKIAK